MRSQHTPDIWSRQLESGLYEVHDERKRTVYRMSRHQLADYIRKHARSEEHVPIGDYLHEGLRRVGFTGCLPCAERQAKLNRMVRRRSGR